MQTPQAHLRGQGCPKCKGGINDSLESFIEKAKKVHGDKYDYSKVEYVNSKTKVCIIYPNHGEFWQRPNDHLMGKGYKEIKKNNAKRIYNSKDRFETFKKRMKSLYGDIYDLSKVEYVNNKTKVCIVCKKHGEFLARPDNLLKGHGCPRCSNNMKYNKDTFIETAKLKHNNKFDYSKVNYVDQKTKVCIICPIHGEFWQTPHNHVNGQGCPKCAGVAKITLNEFKERCNKKHNNKYDYSQIKELKNKLQYVPIICPKHGLFRQKACQHMNGIGCPLCNESHLEKEVRNALIDNNIEFIPQYRNKDLFGLQSLDFYIPSLKLGIECQGEQHFRNSRRYQKLEQIQERDERKNKICKENDIELIYYFNKKYNDLYKFNNQYFNSLNEVISYIAKK